MAHVSVRACGCLRVRLQSRCPPFSNTFPIEKDDYTVARDSTLHPQLSQQGYACVRVDMRGSGSSDGVLMDEYSEQEMQDGEDVIRWIARQKWCDGNIGMIGISWGGITRLANGEPQR